MKPGSDERRTYVRESLSLDMYPGRSKNLLTSLLIIASVLSPFTFLRGSAFSQVLIGKRTSATPKNMVLIHGGTFWMGTDSSAITDLLTKFNVRRAEIFADEVPRHSVKIGAFYLDKHEVTKKEFKKFIDKHPQWKKANIPANMHNGNYLQDWEGDNFPKGKGDYPVVNVSWYGAVAYCQSLGKRLPTEAEWEFAARGGLDNKAFPWGDEPVDKARANYSASGFGAAIKVGSYRPNGYGLYDMAGNVWEYLADEWAKYPASSETAIDPVAGGDLFDRGDSYLSVNTRRVIRGGSWGGSPINLRVTYRDSHPVDGAGNHVGFRCAMPVI
jgi:formylglycine-generating enzyme required for sulfatase activity